MEPETLGRRYGMREAVRRGHVGDIHPVNPPMTVRDNPRSVGQSSQR
jgi:hypothetical protein